MKNNKLLFGLLLLASTSYAEGVGSRGGGRALVCRDAEGKITSARMLDVLEGIEPLPVGYGLTIHETGDSLAPPADKDRVVDQILKTSLDKLTGLTNLKTKVEDSVSSIRSQKIMESADSDLLPPEDLGKVHLIKKPKNCSLEAAGVYFEDQRLHVNPEIYAAMDSTNQAAFFLHEGIYALVRSLSKAESADAKTSEFSRKTTGDMISTLEKVDRSFGWYEYRCSPSEAGGTFLFKTSNGIYVFFLSTRDFEMDHIAIYYQETTRDSFLDYNGTGMSVTCDLTLHTCKAEMEDLKRVPFTRIVWAPSSGQPPIAIDDRNGRQVTGEKLGNR